MKTRILSALLAGTVLFSALGELTPAASAVQDPPAATEIQEPVTEESIVTATSVSVYPKSIWMRAGETNKLTATILPENTTDTSSWTSSDSDVCTVSDSGTVTAVGEGVAVVTVQVGAFTDTCAVYVGLTAPVELDVAVNESGYASLVWNAVEDCDGYRISRRAAEEDAWTDLETLTGTSWTDTTMVAEAGYQYAVRAYKLRDSQTDDAQTIWSAYTISDSLTIDESEAEDTPEVVVTKPAAPTLVSAKALDAGSIRVNWNAVSGASGYRVYRKNGSDWNLIGIIKNGSATSYDDASVKSGVSYTYTVRAYTRQKGKIVLSDFDANGVSATAVSLPTPSLISVTSNAYNSLTFTWAASRNAQGYAVYRKASASDEWKWIANTAAGKTSYTDTSVTCGITYYYTVRSYLTLDSDSKSFSAYSDPGISGKAVPATPALGTVTSQSSSSLKVTWSTVAGATGYNIYRKTSASDSWKYYSFVSGGSKTSFTDTGLTKGQKYYYTVSAYRTSTEAPKCEGTYNTTGISGTPIAAPYSNVYATYSTSYKASQVNRTTNLNIACKTINGTILKPGQTFSFNGTLGERTAAKGYKPATIFTGSVGTAQELGGGICQVASTMFNTALYANLTINERHQHAQRVSYVPLGRDSGIYYGYKNFKFTNNTKYNIKIKAWISGGTLTVQLLTTEEVKPASVKLAVTQSGKTFTLRRYVNGVVNYTTKSTY